MPRHPDSLFPRFCPPPIGEKSAAPVAKQPVVAVEDASAWYAGSIPDKPYSIPLVDRRRLSPAAFGQLVAYQGNERSGTIVVDIDDRFLYLVQGGGTAIRYGIG